MFYNLLLLLLPCYLVTMLPGFSVTFYAVTLLTCYRKIPKISPSMYKPFQIVTQKTLHLIAPPNISPPGGLYIEFALEHVESKVKQSKNGKFPSHYKLAQSIWKRKFPSVHKPLQK